MKWKGPQFNKSTGIPPQLDSDYVFVNNCRISGGSETRVNAAKIFFFPRLFFYDGSTLVVTRFMTALKGLGLVSSRPRRPPT